MTVVDSYAEGYKMNSRIPGFLRWKTIYRDPWMISGSPGGDFPGVRGAEVFE